MTSRCRPKTCPLTIKPHGVGGGGWTRGAAARAVSGRDQFVAGAAWRKAIEVFDEDAGQLANAGAVSRGSLRSGCVPDASVVQLRLSQMRLCRPRQWGACWLAGQLWQELAAAIGSGPSGCRPAARARAGIRCCRCWSAYRLIAPGSEWRLHRQWFGSSAMADLLGADFGLAEIHKLYACHDLLLAHKEALFSHLVAALARPVQRQLRRAALRSDQHLFRDQCLGPCRKATSAATATAGTSGRTARRW